MKPYYSEKNIEIYCGDSLSIMEDIVMESPIYTVTDPPYGVEGGHGGQLQNYRKADYDSFDDNPKYIEKVCVPVIKKCIELSVAVALTPGTRCCFKYPDPTDMGCFWSPAANRLGKFGFQVFHPILYYGKYHRAGRGNWPSGTIMTKASDKCCHPCPKPIDAWRWLIEKVSPQKSTILDPFAGAMTGAVVCKQTGRKFIGIELSQKYIDEGIKRIQNTESFLI